ncbi:helix-turn-helix domain-containing protein [Streptomyces sp. NPDC058200]|uniref:helix-turn-helix domain-containing protein n=1 Tax=Streptomyces sp. NPDC058200 TaxID=3346378 RepID=UPI0036E1ECFF
MSTIRELDPSASPLDYFGAELRRLREAANLNQKQLGAIIYCTGSLIGQIETARKLPTRPFAERVDAALGTQGTLSRLVSLVLRSQLPPWFQPYIEMEARATYISCFQAQLVLGLLQTDDYARAVLGTMVRTKLDERVAARMERQRVLRRENPPLLWSVLSEAVLYQEIGGRKVMRDQLAHLLSCQDEEWVQIQVLPFSAGTHPGQMGSFTVFRFDDDPDIAYTEGYEAGYLTANPKDVKDRSLRYDHLQAAALSVRDSAELIARLMEERYGEQSDHDERTLA